MEAIDARHEHDRPGAARTAVDAPQPEQHRALVLLEDADRERHADEHDERQDDEHIDDGHVAPYEPARESVRPLRAASTVPSMVVPTRERFMSGPCPFWGAQMVPAAGRVVVGRLTALLPTAAGVPRGRALRRSGYAQEPSVGRRQARRGS